MTDSLSGFPLRLDGQHPSLVCCPTQQQAQASRAQQLDDDVLAAVLQDLPETDLASAALGLPSVDPSGTICTLL